MGYAVSTQTPKVSVIVPVYNVEKYLSKCIDSILAQSLGGWELILVDDGSPDRCGKIIDQYAEKDSRIIAIHQENKGVSAARNAGLERATGEYISFVDPDDWVSDTFLEKLVSKIETEKVDIVCCNWSEFIDDDIRPHDVHNVPEKMSREEWFAHVFDSPQSIGVVCWNKLYRRKLITTPFSEGVAVTEDHLFLWHYNKHIHNAAFIHEPLYVYQIRADSVMQKETAAVLEGAPVCREIINIVAPYGSTIRKLAEKNYLHVCLRCYSETKSKDAEKNKKSKDYLLQYLKQHFIRVMTNEQIYWKTRIMYLAVLVSIR